MTEQLPTPDEVAAVLSGEQRRTVAAERDMPRVREWIDQAVRHAVNEAAQALHAVRYWCDQTEAANLQCPVCQYDPEDFCDTCAALTAAIGQVRALLPALPTVGAVSVEGGVDMGTRVTLRGGEDGDAAFGGSETGGGRPLDRDWRKTGGTDSGN